MDGAFERPTSSPLLTHVPMQPATKASVAAPRLDVGVRPSDVEMESLSRGPVAGSTRIREETDVMQLARLGDIGAMEALFERGACKATYADEEGITPLHWAAINNQHAMCKFLIRHGADTNAVCNTSAASPLHWAVHGAHYYTAHLLLQHGANPLLADSSGYNPLHTATFSGHTLLLVLMLHQGIPVDVLDQSGHTGLMWAAYKGYPLLVDVYLRWGADVNARDEQGFTALHWALVKGNPGCVQKLVEYGADRFAATDNGRTPALTAKEQHHEFAWLDALAECGYDQDGHPRTPDMPGLGWLLQDRRTNLSRLLFFCPFVLMASVLVAVSWLPVYSGLPLAVVTATALMYVAQKSLDHAPPDMRGFHKTPWMAGIFAGTQTLVGLDWFFAVMPATLSGSSYPVYLINLAFAAFFGLVVYFYLRSLRSDPGFVPKLNGIAEQKAVIDELLSQWKFDDANFCVTCMVRMPLRSKHCKRCQRCVARHDHHCPWVYNCVGINNHRDFFLYVICLALAIVTFDLLAFYHFLRAVPGASDQCNVFAASLCRLVNVDTFTLLVTVWITTHLTWIVMLLFVQFVQVSRATTTYENMYGVGETTHAALTSTGIPLDPNHPSLHAPARAGHAGHAHHAHGRHGHWWQSWKRLLGVDPFIETVRGTGAATNRHQKQKNPFSRGCITNCTDFWCDQTPVFGSREPGAAVLGGVPVNYLEMYETPSAMTPGMGRRRRGYEAVPSVDTP